MAVLSVAYLGFRTLGHAFATHGRAVPATPVRADLALTATGPVADEWLDVAQAFAGPPGTGRGPLSAGTPAVGA